MWGRGSRFPQEQHESDIPGPGQYDINRDLTVGGNPGVGLHGSAPRFFQQQARSSRDGDLSESMNSSISSSDAGSSHFPPFGPRHPRPQQARASMNSGGGGRAEASLAHAAIRRKELEVQERERQLRTAEQRIVRLESQLAEAKQVTTLYTRRKAAFDQHDRIVAQLQHRLALLEAQAAVQASNAEGVQAALAQQVKDGLAEARRAQGQLEEVVGDLFGSEMTVRTLEGMLQDAQAEAEDLRAELEAARADAEGLRYELRALRGREAAWATERAEVEEHVATLEEALGEARDEEDALLSRCQELDAEVTRLEGSLAQAQARAEATEASNATLWRELQGVHGEKGALALKVQEAEAELAAAAEEANSLRELLAGNEAALAEACGAQETMQRRVEELQREGEEARHAHEDASAALSRVKEGWEGEAANWKERCWVLEGSLYDARAALEEAEAAVAEKEEDYQALQSEASSAVNRALELQRALTDAEARAVEGEAAARGAGRELGRAQQELAALRGRTAAVGLVEDQLLEAKVDSEVARLQAEEAAREVEQLTQEVSSLAGHRNQRQKVKYLERLKAEMLRLQRDNASLEAELSAAKTLVKRLQQRQQGSGGSGGGRLSTVSSLAGGSRRGSTVSALSAGVGSVAGSTSSSGSGAEAAAPTPRRPRVRTPLKELLWAANAADHSSGAASDDATIGSSASSGSKGVFSSLYRHAGGEEERAEAGAGGIVGVAGAMAAEAGAKEGKWGRGGRGALVERLVSGACNNKPQEQQQGRGNVVEKENMGPNVVGSAGGGETAVVVKKPAAVAQQQQKAQLLAQCEELMGRMGV